MWTELKKELPLQHSVIPSNTHATQAFTQLEQGPDELLDDYLHCVSELSKIYTTLLTCLAFKQRALTILQ